MTHPDQVSRHRFYNIEPEEQLSKYDTENYTHMHSRDVDHQRLEQEILDGEYKYQE